MGKPSIDVSQYASTLDRVVRELMNELKLPGQFAAMAEMYLQTTKAEIAANPERVPKIARMVRDILRRQLSPMAKVEAIIEEVGTAMGREPVQRSFDAGFMRQRLKDSGAEPRLPEILARAEGELNNLLR